MSLKIRIVMTLLLMFPVSGAEAFQCSIATTPVNFGFYDLLSLTNQDSTGTVTVTCNNPTQNSLLLTLELNAGNSGSFAQRRMTSTAPGGLVYNLYADTARSQILGDGSGGSVHMTYVISKVNIWNMTIYGRIPARQNVIPGLYSDSITATVLW